MVRKTISVALLWAAIALYPEGRALASPQSELCASAAERMPARPRNAITGSTFARRADRLTGDEREAAILAQLTAGNVPSFLRQMVPVVLHGADGTQATICVAPDYLAIGSNSDYFLIPMRLETALVVAQRQGFVLPTRRMVDAIYQQAAVHLAPQPLPPGDIMTTTGYYKRHNNLVRTQRTATGARLGVLTAGNKKDLVITTRLRTLPHRVAIYGWHQTDGAAIQPLSTVHGMRYADYSHGVRLVGATAFVDGKPRPVLELMEDARYAALFSDEDEPLRPRELLTLLLPARGAAGRTTTTLSP